MKTKTLIWLIIIWITLIIISHYALIIFSVSIWLIICLSTFIFSVYQLINLLQFKNTTKARFQNFSISTILLLVTFFHLGDAAIEKIDWYILYNKRMEVVEQLKNNKLDAPIGGWNNQLYHLPYTFPILSTDGNNIIVIKDSIEKNITVKFFIRRSGWDNPSDMFIYSNDPQEIKRMENLIPVYSRKIRNNWYRVNGF